jgi:uncharacterized protein YwgA
LFNKTLVRLTEANMVDQINRKDLLLALLYAPGTSGETAEPIDGRTRLMKLLFLLQSELPASKHGASSGVYRFQAYHYGPFAKDVYEDLEFLENVGLVDGVGRGDAGHADQSEEEKIVEDSTIGVAEDESAFLFEEQRYKLTLNGRQFVLTRVLPDLPEAILAKAQELKERFANVPLSSLLRFVYSAYPEYAKNSKLQHLVSVD